MKTSFDTDVLICGAGPTGLALALVLARHGVAFRLMEKSARAFHGSRGKGLQPRTLEIFDNLGILAQAVALGGPYPPQRVYCTDGPDGRWQEQPSVEVGAPDASVPHPAPLMLPQYLTEGVMRASLAEGGHATHFDHALAGFIQDADGVDAEFTHGDATVRLRARYLVGADGGRSVVRHVLKLDFPGKTLGVRAVVADLSLPGLSRDAWHRYGDGDMTRQLSLCPLAGTELIQLQAPVPLEGEVDLSASGLTQMIAQRSGRDDLVVGEVHWASAYTMNARLAERYRVARVFLAGDAAHIHPPTGGQGLNTSVQDAWNLGWKLAAVLGGADAALLDTYEEERRPIAEAMLGLSTRLLAAAGRGDMRRGREVQQLDLGYPDASLALMACHGEYPLVAGERAPDAQVTTRAGRATRLFELFRGPHWTLLGRRVAGQVVPSHAGAHVYDFSPGGDLADTHGQWQQAYGLAEGDWVLIRPDGYVGALVSAGREAALADYLALNCVAPRR